MAAEKFAFYPFIKRDSRSEKDFGYLYIRITVDSQRKEYSTNTRWSKKKWDMKKSRATGTKEDALTLNAYIDTLQSKATEIKNRMISENRRFTALDIVNNLVGNVDDRKFCLELLQEHNDKMGEMVGIPDGYAEGTYRKFKDTYNHAQNFIKKAYKRDDLELRELNYEFAEGFYHYLRTSVKCAHNTTVKYIQFFKKIVLNAFKKGWIHRDPFFGFALTQRYRAPVKLTMEEIRSLTNKVFLTERLGQVRDYFIFSCFTGLAYSDIKNLRRTDIVEDENGNRWIKLFRQKTDSYTRMPLLKPARAMLDKYWEDEECISKNRCFPVRTNQKVNEYLKEIADLCGIFKRLNYHLARHTFATTVTLKNGVPMETVQLLLAHASIKETQKYSIVDDEKIKEDMSALEFKLGPDLFEQAMRKIGDTTGKPQRVIIAYFNEAVQSVSDQTVRKFDCRAAA